MVPVVSPAWLEKHPEAVIVDLRWALGATTGYESYLEGHIPGAVFIDLDTELSAAPTVEGGRHPLPDPADFVQPIEVVALLHELAEQRFGFGRHGKVKDEHRLAFTAGGGVLRHPLAQTACAFGLDCIARKALPL